MINNMEMALFAANTQKAFSFSGKSTLHLKQLLWKRH